MKKNYLSVDDAAKPKYILGKALHSSETGNGMPAGRIRFFDHAKPKTDSCYRQITQVSFILLKLASPTTK